MADISNIRLLASKLNLSNIAKGKVDLNIKCRNNLDYIERIFINEIDLRRKSRIKTMKETSNLPNIKFKKTGLNSGLAWQINKLEKLEFIKECKNIIITGNSAKGKTALVVSLCNKAIDNGNKVVYLKLYEYIDIIRDKMLKGKESQKYRNMRNSDIIVLDDFLYLNISNEDLDMLFKSLSSFNECHSIILVANRKIQDFQDATENKFLMNSLIDRLKSDSHIVRL